MTRWAASVGMALFLGLAGATAGFSQVTTGTLFGIVQDASGAIIPGATVTIRNIEMGITRTAVTDSRGDYRVANLPLGTYSVSAELSGFQTVVRSGIVLTVGREAEVNFSLSVGELADTIEVTGEAPLVNTTTSQLADLVDQQQMESLPLRSRSYTELALLAPGVMTREAQVEGEYSGTTGGGVKLAISGARPQNTGFYMDGMDVKDALGRTPASVAGTTLGVDTIREFQVLVSSFSAEFGGSGGVINAVTKSGTNTFRGSAFYQLRHSAMDAPDFRQEERGEDVPPFHRHQAGFTIGGPLVRDRTFFFGTYELLSQRDTSTPTINVFGADLKAGITPNGVVPVHPMSKAYLDTMPLPNGVMFPDGRGEYTYELTVPIDQNYVMGKIDHQFNTSNSLAVRYTRDVAEVVPGLPFPGFTQPAKTNLQYMTSEYNRIISPRLLNTARFSINRSLFTAVNAAEGFDESLNLIPLPGRVPPNLTIPGISSWGNQGFNDRHYGLTSFQFSDKISWTAGRHAVVGGIELSRIHLDGYSASRLHGRVRFDSVNDFLVGIPSSWEFLVPGTGSDPAEPGQADRSFRQHQFGFFIQDDFRPTSNLTLNAGLRWEFVDAPTEVNGRISNLRHFMDPVETVGDPFFNPPKANFGPRLGFAWDIRGTGRTALRGGAGIFHQQLNFGVWQISAVQTGPYFIRAQIDDPAWPPPFEFDLNNLPPASPSPIEFNPKTPSYVQYNLTLQHQLTDDTVVAVSYAGSQGRNLPSLNNYNQAEWQLLPDGRKFWPAGLERRNPNFAAIEERSFRASSEYNSAQVRFNKRFAGGLQIQNSYTYSETLDDVSESQAVSFSDPFDPGRDWGLSDWHVKHNYTLNTIYQLPDLAGPGLARALLGGWEIGGILNVRSGLAQTVEVGFNRSRNLNIGTGGLGERPNLKPGASTNPVLGGPDTYADVSAFELQPAGTQGNVGRNTLIGPGLVTFDLSVVKNVPLGGSRNLEFRLAFFNLFNKANYGSPNSEAFTNARGNPNPSFGRINTTSTTPRQGQIVVKVHF